MMNDNEDSGDAAGIPQDDYIARLRPVPAEPPQRVLMLRGLLGDSDRQGHRRLYLNRSLDHYAEFAAADVLAVDRIPPERRPFVGTAATQVTLRRDAAVAFTYERRARPVDEFDLDLRLGGVRPGGPRPLDFTADAAGCFTGDPAGCQVDTVGGPQCGFATVGPCTGQAQGCGPTGGGPGGYTDCMPQTCNGDVFSCAEGNTCVVC
jgi:hypothetical protein